MPQHSQDLPTPHGSLASDMPTGPNQWLGGGLDLGVAVRTYIVTPGNYISTYTAITDHEVEYPPWCMFNSPVPSCQFAGPVSFREIMQSGCPANVMLSTSPAWLLRRQDSWL